MNIKKDNKLEEDIEEQICAYTLYKDVPTVEKKNENSNLDNNPLAKNQPNSNSRPKYSFNANFQNEIPLLIKDILNIKIDANSFGKNLYAYGVQFGDAMIYGICTPKGFDYKTRKLKYTLDDGTGEIYVKYSLDKNKELRNEIAHLQERLNIEIGKSRGDSNAADLNESLANILRAAEKNIHIPEQHYAAGSRVYVVGTPYKIYNDVWIHAKHFELDNDADRCKENIYKELLVQFYDEFSKKFKLDGSKIE